MPETKTIVNASNLCNKFRIVSIGENAAVERVRISSFVVCGMANDVTFWASGRIVEWYVVNYIQARSAYKTSLEWYQSKSDNILQMALLSAFCIYVE
jgi:hypothetical protein